MSAALPLTPAQVDVEFKLLHAAFVRMRLDAWMTAISIVVFGSLMWRLFPTQPMLIWAFAFALNLTYSCCLSAAYRRRQSHFDQRTLRYWQCGLIAYMAFAGLGWTVGPVLMIGQATGPYVALFASILLVACAVATISLAEQQWAMRAYLVTALVPTAAAALWAGGSGMGLVAMVLVTGAVAMATVGRGSNHATRALVETEVRLQAALTLAGVAREDAVHARIQAEHARMQAEHACIRAEAASAAKTRFLANMSHELRTPLNAVIGGAELLRVEQTAPDAQTVQRIDSIQRSGTHLLGLIENILDLSRIEHGEMVLYRENFNLADCLEGAIATATVLAHVKGLCVRFEVAPGLALWRHGDAQRVRQVALNLLGNAVKFTQHGEVSLRLQAASARATPPTLAADWVHISVSDSGVGISEAALPHIFDPFHQADQGSNRRFGGSGLGLSIVRLWVERMGGHVGVQSQLGQGSCFTVALPFPLAEPEAQITNHDAAKAVAQRPMLPLQSPMPACVSAAASVSTSAHSRHILVVEDDEINQAVVCGLLRHAGHRVSAAVNGTQAIAKLTDANNFDLVFMDCQMPDIDGLEVTRRLRAGQAGPAGQRVPIVALTANAFAEDRTACLVAGMNDFLSKPVLMADLLAAVARALPQAAAGTVQPASASGAATAAAADALTASAPAYDPRVLAALPTVADGSAPKYAQELLALFAHSTSASLLAIQAAAKSDDRKVLQRLLHTLKSSSASVGALQLGLLAAAGEADLRQGRMPAVDLHSRLHCSFEAYKKAASIQLSVRNSEGQSA